ncbi:hypothetical protein GJU40_16245 [Bacillus lacus]|uniref:Uncharacterized protein n=1 Tax=Metabacillus lacus TaxID=1983721 RepID=A0A7X2J215_9BACI|nr:hypothetical protein [Metabacillus lacus]MRX73692.1 hypothetical protein [Metabacillus lacus]
MNKALAKNQTKTSIFGVISIAIPIVLTLLILNYFAGLIPLETLQGLPIVLPLFFCPIGAFIGFVSYRISKDGLSLYGIIANLALFLFPILYNVFATFLYGV